MKSNLNTNAFVNTIAIINEQTITPALCYLFAGFSVGIGAEGYFRI
jgi:hypothetical protein